MGAVREAARRLVISSCREQGIEPKIIDPVVIGKVAAVLDSDAPPRLDAVRVETVEAPPRGLDRDVVDERGEDRPAARERQVVPAVAEG
jgi:hypothetical protein